ncbi:MAG: nucleotide sugar dehydrogenase [Vicinamibacteria bacterium]|jgi:UDP-N-acetyl-D-glucosamine dehydrogenase|nr:nucleotide sugar dehydrogenase [Vicinamibacteria bacterium]
MAEPGVVNQKQAALVARIAAGEALVGTIGLGYVGLPLAVEFASAGLRVRGFDIAEEKVAAINRGESYVKDVPAARVAEHVQAGRLVASADFAGLAECDAIIICVPTPLGKTKDPDLSMVVDASEAIAQHQRPGQLIVLESTTYPGTTEELIQPILERGGLKAGNDFFLAFSPERVDPGNPRYHTRNTPKIIGGVTPECTAAAKALYSRAVETVIEVSSTRTAEMVKLLENTFRSVNIGLVNEVALMCERLGVNVWEVIEAAASKPFGFMPFYPGPGLGGHCIPIDPLYLSWKMKTLNYRARFIELAGEINSEMPEYVCERVALALNDQKKAVNGSRILVVGVAYKKDIDDVRESPALDIINVLRSRGATVLWHDPFVPSVRFGEQTEHSAELMPAVRQCDAVVIVTDHGGLSWPEIVDAAPLVLDTRNATRGLTSPKLLRL